MSGGPGLRGTREGPGGGGEARHLRGPKNYYLLLKNHLKIVNFWAMASAGVIYFAKEQKKKDKKIAMTLTLCRQLDFEDIIERFAKKKVRKVVF